MNQPPDGILDTSTVTLLPRLSDTSSLPAYQAVTSITLAELSVGPLVATDDATRAANSMFPTRDVRFDSNS